MMKHQGFSLLELLVAVAIFAVVATLAWGGLDTIVRARRTLDDASLHLARLQRTINRFDRDMSTALPRPSRDERDLERPALIGNNSQVEATTAAPLLTTIGEVSTSRRVSWRCDGDRLLRTHWAAGSHELAANGNEQVQLSGVNHCRFRYIAADGSISDYWPPQESRHESLPIGIEIAFEYGHQGEFHRLIELARTPERPR